MPCSQLINIKYVRSKCVATTFVKHSPACVSAFWGSSMFYLNHIDNSVGQLNLSQYYHELHWTTHLLSGKVGVHLHKQQQNVRIIQRACTHHLLGSLGKVFSPQFYWAKASNRGSGRSFHQNHVKNTFNEWTNRGIYCKGKTDILRWEQTCLLRGIHSLVFIYMSTRR